MPVKPYSHPDDEQQHQQRLNEPSLAYGYDLNALKVEAIGLLMDIDTPALLHKAIDSLSHILKEGSGSPIQFTVEELKDELKVSVEQSSMGLGISQEEMLNRKPSWMKSE